MSKKSKLQWIAITAYENGHKRGHNKGFNEGQSKQLNEDIDVAQKVICNLCNITAYRTLHLNDSCDSCIMKSKMKDSLESGCIS